MKFMKTSLLVFLGLIGLNYLISCGGSRLKACFETEQVSEYEKPNSIH